MKYLEWFGTATSIAGSFLVSFHFFLLGYCFFLLGGLSWLVVGFVSKNKPLMTLNGFFLVANLIGVYNA